jgi:hypothetical protein
MANPPLEYRAVEINNPQRAEWSDFHGYDNQSFEYPNGGVKQRSKKRASEKCDSQSICEVNVSKNIGDER